MKLLIGIVFLLLVIGIATSVPGNSSRKSIIPVSIARNITNQMNNSINQTNITIRMNSSNLTNTTTPRILSSNGVIRLDTAIPLKAAFESEPQSSPGSAVDRVAEGAVMGTPSQAAFESSVF